MTSLPRRALVLGSLALAYAGAFAQTGPYPSRPIKLIVGYPAGGASDVAARIIGQKLSERMGQAVVVENRAGSAGNIGADAVAKAAPDGYTLLLGTISLSVNPSLYPKMTYDPVKDLTAISMISSTPFLLVVNPATPYKTVRELLDAAKKSPGVINYATAGNGSGSHLFTELLDSTANIKLTHVPYKGAAPAMNDVLGNQVGLTFDNIITTLPLVKAGKLRPLAVSTKQRSKVAPDIPTLDESGVPGFDATAWFGLFAPAGTPHDIVTKLAQEVAVAVKDPVVNDKLLALGAEPVSSTPDAFSAFFKGEVAKWGQVVRSAKVQVE
ncbi:tripartite tricarboxylate transporter substrate binding protein [Caenimonas aquaedulcis]|uniref:Tripartite tricarboxylate transporter substrate binding protein n=1 Tax=Caenimonas aquaedulcis TaxID=2793270 RepID=A0A931H8H6_9BURK|nr:tripartite tricarboxylate transporter substrate binding protein [Caenimonas aquaedulcis]MBG9390669.1 tripartite tricarboxylate transporter substrate binding protein [Caenimonas aquaedulcis]